MSEKRRARPTCYAIIKGEVVRAKTVAQLKEILEGFDREDITFVGRGQEFTVNFTTKSVVELKTLD